ncbi:hypothetical protein AaE_011462 [Aphanomyces astaci]|uniref:Uncharacterized protein n=1 Tax=Aphanomyces astaci TaxID=112090 RepID=A0A6A4ZJ22_APHAT|nr:hypothetical protein AaE_011462 [Aphanomyces astaci]
MQRYRPPYVALSKLTPSNLASHARQNNIYNACVFATDGGHDLSHKERIIGDENIRPLCIHNVDLNQQARLDCCDTKQTGWKVEECTSYQAKASLWWGVSNGDLRKKRASGDVHILLWFVALNVHQDVGIVVVVIAGCSVAEVPDMQPLLQHDHVFFGGFITKLSHDKHYQSIEVERSQDTPLRPCRHCALATSLFTMQQVMSMDSGKTTLSSWAGKTMGHFRSTTRKSLDGGVDEMSTVASTSLHRLMRKSDSKDADALTAFLTALDDKDVNGVTSAVQNTPKFIEFPIHNDGILLHALCRWPNLSDVLHLLELAVRTFPEGVAFMDEMGRTPLHWLCMNPTVCARGIEVLVLGFPVSAAMCDKESSLPIHYLSCNPSQTIDMTLKLQHYETFALRNREGRTPLHCLLARHSTDFELCATLLSLAPEAISIADNMGRHILHWACAGKKSLDMQLLQLVLTLDPTAASRSDMKGQLPLHVLVSNQLVTVDAIQLLLPAYPQAVDVIDAVGSLLSRLLSSVLTQFCQQSGQSPLHLLGANESVHLAMLVALIDPGRHVPTSLKWLDDVWKQSLEHSSALHILCTNPRATTAMVELVLQTYPASAQLVDLILEY